MSSVPPSPYVQTWTGPDSGAVDGQLLTNPDTDNNYVDLSIANNINIMIPTDDTGSEVDALEGVEILRDNKRIRYIPKAFLPKTPRNVPRPFGFPLSLPPGQYQFKAHGVVQKLRVGVEWSYPPAGAG